MTKPLDKVSAPSDWPPAQEAWRIVLIVTFVYAIAFVHRIGMSLVVGPMQADLQFTDTQIGMLTGLVFAIPYALGGPIFGWVADNSSRRRLMALAASTWSLFTAATGLVSSFGWMAAVRAGLGMTQSALQPAAASVIADCFSASERPRAYGVYVAGTAFGTALAYWLGALAIGAGEFLSNRYGVRDWTGSFLALAVLGLLAPVALIWVREPVRREQLETGVASLKQTLVFARRHTLIIVTLCLAVAITYMAAYGQLAFMPVMFERQYGWGPAKLATAFGTVAIVVGTFGSVLAGWYSSWLARRGRLNGDWIVCFWGGIGTLLPGVLAPLMPSGTLSLLMFSLSGLFTNWPAVGALAAITRFTPNQMRGQLTAVQTSTVGLIGAGLGPLSVGMLSDYLPESANRIGLALSVTFGVCMVLGGILLLLGWRRYTELVHSGGTGQLEV
jgi:MFS family permease